MELKIRSSLIAVLFMVFWIFSIDVSSQVTVNKVTSEEPKTIMAIFAHPDDETVVSPVLAKYASNARVHVIIATDGRYGVTDHFSVSHGDSLVAIRTREMICACKKLGVPSPYFLKGKDGLGLNGKNNFYKEARQLKERIKSKIEELNPDIILTFGPDGDTGHPDHRMVGLFTTEVLLQENWTNEIHLYYFAWTKEQTKKFPEDWGLGWSHPDVLHTKITFSQEEENRAFASMRCHQSQYTNAELDEWIKAERDDTTNVLYFRKFAIDTTERNGF